MDIYDILIYLEITVKLLQKRYKMIIYERKYYRMNKLIIDKESPLPLYAQIKEDMKDKINSDILHEDDYLPSEFKLMEEYNVSRTTIRQAIELLVQENYLERKRGVGTLITKPKKDYWDLSELRSFDEEAQRKGMISKTKLLDFSIVDSNSELADVFGKNEEKFYKLERLRYINNSPLELVTTYIPKSLAEDLEKFDFSNNSLFDILHKYYYIRLSYAEKTFNAINISKEDSKILDIPQRSAIQLVKTVTFDINYNPVEFSISKDRGLISKFKLTLNRKKNEK